MISYSVVYCIRYGDEALSREELIALTRDHLGRKDPDEFLNGFFPVWAAIQFLVACKSLHNARRAGRSHIRIVYFHSDLFQVSSWSLLSSVSFATSSAARHRLGNAPSESSRLVCGQ